MIPASMTCDLLNSLLQRLLTQNGQPDYHRFCVPEELEKTYQNFFAVLLNSEDDLTFILSLQERDPDCLNFDPVCRLEALVDYVKIACAIYQGYEIGYEHSRLH